MHVGIRDIGNNAVCDLALYGQAGLVDLGSSEIVGEADRSLLTKGCKFDGAVQVVAKGAQVIRGKGYYGKTCCA